MFFSINFLFYLIVIIYIFIMFGYKSFFLGLRILFLSFVFFIYYCFFNLWFSLIFFLIYIGGLLVLFFYIFSLKSNPNIIIKLNYLFLIFFIFFLCSIRIKYNFKKKFFPCFFFFNYNFDLLKNIYYLIILCLFLLYVLFLIKKFLFNFKSFIRFFN